MPKCPLVLVDGNHIARRSYHTVGRSLRTSKGLSSGAFFGSLTTLRKIALNMNPCAMRVFFDDGHDQASKIYPEYKKSKRNREEDFYYQLDSFEQAVRLIGIPCFRVHGVEADTLIALHSTELGGKDRITFIVSSDKDFFQLLRKGVRVHDDLRSRTYSKADFKEMYEGLVPKDMAGLKALSGDKSDNVPGLPGIGEDTALKLLVQMGGLKGLKKFAAGGPPPDPDDFDERVRWRIRKAFENPGATRKVLLRNLKLVMLPKNHDELPRNVKEASYDQFEEQVGSSQQTNLTELALVLNKYEVMSILKDIKSWAAPLCAAGRKR